MLDDRYVTQLISYVKDSLKYCRIRRISNDKSINQIRFNNKEAYEITINIDIDNFSCEIIKTSITFIVVHMLEYYNELWMKCDMEFGRKLNRIDNCIIIGKLGDDEHVNVSAITQNILCNTMMIGCSK